jgi:hypothetical protein
MRKNRVARLGGIHDTGGLARNPRMIAASPANTFRLLILSAISLRREAANA